MLHRGDTGSTVLQLQRELLALGYTLPRWGADANLGNETFAALDDFLRDHGEVAHPNVNTVSDELLAYVHTLAVRLASDFAFPKPTIIDRRHAASRKHDFGPRSWNRVTGWCLHQTACHLGASRDLARCDNVGAHFVVYQDGRIFWLHDLERLVDHGNAWNSQTIGIEIDGLFAGLEDNPATVWDDPSTPYHEKAMSLTEVQADAVKALIRWGTGEVAAHGGKITKLVAHRQSSMNRRNDPGSKVWQQIAIPLSAELGFDFGGAGFKIGGYPIPLDWDPRGSGLY